MTKQQACKRLAEIQGEIIRLQNEASKIGDDTGVPFRLSAVGASNIYIPEKFEDELAGLSDEQQEALFEEYDVYSEGYGSGWQKSYC